MNILTFDIEDWYNCDFISGDFNWDKHEVRIYQGVNRILTELEKRNQKGTFFCLGWIAERHPDVIRSIQKQGHHIGCHSYQHELSFRFDEKTFKADTLKAKRLIEDVTGEEVNAFRAPGFSITKNNTWALYCLAEMGFRYDCSMFPAPHDYGGMPSYGEGVPKRIDIGDGRIIKEFPINIHRIMGKHIVFDEGQPVMKNLPAVRRFKSYVGIKGAFTKFQRLLDHYEFYNVEQADELINWDTIPIIQLDSLK